MNQLGDLNLRLQRWHTSLPEGLQWSQWNPDTTKNAHVLVLHLYYHAMLLSLNRHFIRPAARFPQSDSLREACISSTDIIAILIRQYRLQHGLHTAPLMLVYALVMAIITQLHTLAAGREGLAFLSKALDECAHQYKIAADAQTRLAIFLRPMVSDSFAGDDGHGVNSSVDTFNAATVAQLSGLDGVAVDPLLDPGVFDSNAFDDVDGVFNSWFSIGQMGSPPMYRRDFYSLYGPVLQ